MTFYADYRLLLPMPPHIIYGVDRYKKASAKYIGSFKSMDSPAHISIVRRQRCKPHIAESGFSRMERKLNSMPPLKLAINGFDFFNHGDRQNTIYARLIMSEANQKWFRLLFDCLDEKPGGFTPHLTVVRDISRQQFDTLWPFFAKMNYQDTFEVDHLKIHKMDTYFGTDWVHFRNIYFLNKLSV